MADVLFQGAYMASGGLSLSIPDPGNDILRNLWFSVIDTDIQLLISVRDGFNPNNYFVSPQINYNSGSDTLTTLSGVYPTNDVAGLFNLIGVPT